jgi:nitrogen regulatory protein PII
MKAIKAFVRNDRADPVLQALSAASIGHVTLCHVFSTRASANGDARVDIEYGCRVVPMIQLEIICADRQADTVVNVIREAACTCRPGDGIIMVQNINRLIKIRTASESAEAL